MFCPDLSSVQSFTIFFFFRYSSKTEIVESLNESVIVLVYATAIFAVESKEIRLTRKTTIIRTRQIMDLYKLLTISITEIIKSSQ